MAMTIITSTETLTTMPLEEFGPWLRKNNLTVVDIVPNGLHREGVTE